MAPPTQQLTGHRGARNRPVVCGSYWPNPGIREGQVCGSSARSAEVRRQREIEHCRGAELRMLATQSPRFAKPPGRGAGDALVEICLAQSAAPGPPSLWQPDSSNHPNPRTRYLPQRRSLDAAQQAFVWLPGAASGDKAPGRIDDGASCTLSRSCRFERVVHTGELLGAQALDIQQTVSIDVENGEGPVHHARRCAIHQFHDDAGLANALSGKVGNTGDVFPPEHSHEGRAGQRVQRVVSGEQKQLR